MKIGIFDSGYGGLSIFRGIEQLLPEYDYVYLGDNARTPYGSRSFQTILAFTTECVEFLFRLDCHLIIIACNTASAKALRSIQQQYLPKMFPERRVLGVIRPSVEQMCRHTRSRTVALWATEGTVRSLSYVLEVDKLAPEVRLVQQVCPMLVPLVEAGELDGPPVDYFVDKYWRETERAASDIDTLLLACTHYPLLAKAIRQRVPESIRVLVQSDFVAPSLQDYLLRHPEHDRRLSRDGTRRFLTTDRSEAFDRLAAIFLGYEICSERIDLG
ncbi:MAG: glutamate racemase [Acidobacteria bacterium]|nr:MAG: glutamate racemase [Acidobacteriota bacterium]